MGMALGAGECHWREVGWCWVIVWVLDVPSGCCLSHLDAGCPVWVLLGLN